MAYKHNKKCSTCLRIKEEVGKDHHGRVASKLFKAVDDYLMDKRTMVDIVEEYAGIISLQSLSNHTLNHQLFGAEDIATSKIQALQRKSADEKINLILKSAVKADEMRGMMKQVFEEIMQDDAKRAEFVRKFKPSDAIKMINDEETLELKKVDSTNEILKTMAAFASGSTTIEIPDSDVTVV